MITAVDDARKFNTFLHQIVLTLLAAQLRNSLRLCINKLHAGNIRHGIDPQRALLAVHLAGRGTAIALTLQHGDGKALVAQDNRPAAIRARGHDNRVVRRAPRRAEQRNRRRHAVHADVDQRAAAELQAEDVGRLARQHRAVAAAVAGVRQRRAVDGPHKRQRRPQRLEVALLQVPVGLEE